MLFFSSASVFLDEAGQYLYFVATNGTYSLFRADWNAPGNVSIETVHGPHAGGVSLPAPSFAYTPPQLWLQYFNGANITVVSLDLSNAIPVALSRIQSLSDVTGPVRVNNTHVVWVNYAKSDPSIDKRTLPTQVLVFDASFMTWLPRKTILLQF